MMYKITSSITFSTVPEIIKFMSRCTESDGTFTGVDKFGYKWALTRYGNVYVYVGVNDDDRCVTIYKVDGLDVSAVKTVKC